MSEVCSGEQTFAQLRTGLTSTETIRLIRDREKGWGEGGMEMRGEGDYIPIATLSPPE